MTTWLAKFNNLLGVEDSDRQFILKQAGGVFLIRAFYKGINFLIAVLLTRYLTIWEYGTYTLAFSWAYLLSVPALFGIDRLATRELAHLQIKEKWPLLRGFLLWSFRNSILLLIAGSLIFIAGTTLFVQDQALRNGLWMASLLIPAFGLVRILQNSAEGLKVIAIGRIPDMIIQPIAFVFIVILIQKLVSAWLNTNSVLFLYAVTTYVFSIGLGAMILFQSIPKQVLQAVKDVNITDWKARAAPFLFINILSVTDTRLATLMLGFWASKPDVALYTIATRGTDVISFILAAFAPPVVRIGLQAYLNNRPAKLQRVVSRSVWLMLLISMPIAVFFIVWGKTFLMFFGPQYVAAYPALIILSMGEIVNVLSGNLGQLLAASGYERYVSRTIGISLGINATVGILLIPQWGLLGAAVSEATSLIFRNVTFLFLAKRKMNIQIPFLFHF